MFARFSSADHGRVFGLDRNRLEVRILLLEEAGDARDRPACSNSRDDGVDIIAAVRPNLGSRGCGMDIRVGGILELLRPIIKADQTTWPPLFIPIKTISHKFSDTGRLAGWS